MGLRAPDLSASAARELFHVKQHGDHGGGVRIMDIQVFLGNFTIHRNFSFTDNLRAAVAKLDKLKTQERKSP